MFQNEEKGFYGSLSKVGRDAAIHAFLKLSGYKSGPKKNEKKQKILKMDGDNLDYFKDNLIIVKSYYNNVKNINKSYKKTETNKKKEEKLKFHKLFHPQTEIDESKYINSPSCTKYTPKYDLVFPTLITGPKWIKISGRKYKKLEIDEKDFLITHDSNIDNHNKFLVNMNRTTKRGDFPGYKGSKINSDKCLDKTLKINKSKKIKNKKSNNFTNNMTDIKVKNKKKKIKNNNDKNNENNKLKNIHSINETNDNSKLNIKIEQSFDSNDNKDNKDNIDDTIKKSKSITIKSKSDYKSRGKNKKKTKNELIKSNKFLYKTVHIENNKSSNIFQKKNEDEITPNIKNNTINFEKIISREKRNKLDAKPRYLDVARIINYSLVEERPKAFIFNKSKKNSNIIKKFKGIDPNLAFDADKANNIRTIHSFKKVPIFNLILPRPGNEKNHLPSFMQKLYNREAIYSINDKTLELNRYSKGKLGKVESSFFPKRSFNNIVNIQIIAGKNFQNEFNIDDINHKKDEIKNNIKSKSKNIGKLIKEGALTKFDNITFKTIHKTTKFLNSDLNKYLSGLKE